MPPKLTTFMAQFTDQPALIEEGRGAWLEACLAKVDEVSAELHKIEAGAEGGFWFASDDPRAYFRPYNVIDGVLHVPVKGVLMNNFPYSYGTYATGYEYIWEAVKRGIDDENVKGIALVIDSGGGLVAGNFALVDKIFAMRGRKPIYSFANEHAYSAAYAIASVADRLTVAGTGGVGSIGVVVVHTEYSKLLADAGVTTTIIRSKPGKMEGNYYEALGKDAEARIQARVDELHEKFVAMVARNRGMTVEAVDRTDALTFMPQQAIDNGLADEIGNFDDAITAFVATINTEGGEQMAETYTKAQLDEAVAAALETATANAKAEGMKEGAAAEQARISAILDSEEAKTRPAMARTMVNLGVPAETATAELAKLPEEKATVAPQPAQISTGGAPTGMLKDAMANSINQPGIVAGASADETDVLSPEAQAAEDALLLRSMGISNFTTEPRQ